MRERSRPGAKALLLALLVLGTGLALAQPAAIPPGAGAPAAQRAGAGPAVARTPSWTLAQIDDAFRMTDSNGDGVISREEAAIWTGLSQNFELADANRDGVISRSEFEQRLR